MSERKEPKRYKFLKDEDMQAQYDMQCECCMIEASSGQYVSIAAYDALAAEREALAADASEWAGKAAIYHDAMQDAERERDALRGDAERLDWLQRNATSFSCFDPENDGSVWALAYTNPKDTDGADLTVYSSSLRNAIDAARALDQEARG